MLFTIPPPANAVHVKDRCMRGQAGPDGRIGIFARPFNDSGEALPIRLVLQILLYGLGPGYDDTIELLVPERLHTRVKAFDIASARLLARNARQRVEG